jgi:iron complex transport system permease protein
MNKRNTFVFLLISILLELFWKLDFQNAKLILTELRIPRLILAFGIGSALSLSGSVMQTLLNNPLAEPYTLGVAAGAALGAAIFQSMGWNIGLYGLNVGAVIGAILVLFLILKLIIKNDLRFDSVILVGVMTSFFCSSLLAIWMALADPIGVQRVNFWLMGDLSRVGIGPALAILFLSTAVFFYYRFFSKKLDAFLFGETMVEGFGVSLQDTRRIGLILVSILVGFCVSAAGMIGFVGLMIPHLVRKKLKTSIHGKILPYLFLWGGGSLVLSDSIAHAISFPMELPVGSITALLGAPAFIYLFVHQRWRKGASS